MSEARIYTLCEPMALRVCVSVAIVAKARGEAVGLVDALREYERIMREFAGIETQHLENS